MSTEIADPYVALATELGHLGRRLDGMGAALLELRAAAPAEQRHAAGHRSYPGDQPHPGAQAHPGAQPDVGDQPHVGAQAFAEAPVGRGVPDHPGAPFRAGVQPYPGSSPYATAPWARPVYPHFPGGRPLPGQQHPGGPFQPVPQGSGPGLLPAGTYEPPASRRALSALSGARLLAWTGGAVTLLGVVLLLVLAASRGWFSPPTRIGAGVVLGAALIAAALWLYRRESARIGALALAATGVATLYLVVAAATAVYGYLAAAPALVLALLVAAGGLGLADRWRSELLGAGVVAGAMLLAPALSSDWLLVALALALQLAALPVVVRRRWPVLMLTAAAGPVLFGSVIGLLDGADRHPPTIAAVLGVLVVGLATAAPAARLLPRRPVGALVAATPAPVLVTGITLGGWGGGALAAGAAAALAGLAAGPGTDRRIRLVAVTAAALALFVASAVALHGASFTLVVLGQAVSTAMLAAVLRTRLPLVVGLVYGAVGVLTALGRDAALAALVQFPGAVPASSPAVSVLVLVLAVALLVAGGRVGLIRPDSASARLWVPIGVTGLYGATSTVVGIALLVSPDRAGFTTGHALVTVSWTVVALVLLAGGIRRPALRITGLVLVAAAVAKLVLFDLVALDGLARVAAFLGAGLVLLAAGTRYARVVAEAEAGPGPGARTDTATATEAGSTGPQGTTGPHSTTGARQPRADGPTGPPRRPADG